MTILDPYFPPLFVLGDDRRLYEQLPNGDTGHHVHTIHIEGFTITPSMLRPMRPGDVLSVEHTGDGWRVSRVRWSWWRFWRPAGRRVLMQWQRSGQ